MTSVKSMRLTMAAVLGLGAIAISPVANAQLSAVGPFVGNTSEHFESFTDFVHTSPIFSFEPSPASVFGGTATLTGANLFVFNPGAGSNFRLGSSGDDAMPTDGAQGMGSAFGGASTVTFNQAIRGFGGYFGARTGVSLTRPTMAVFPDPATFVLSFFDSANNQVGATQSWTYSRTGFADGLLEWHGYFSTTPFTKVVIDAPGTAFAYDNLQAVPEPGVLVSLIGAGTVGGLLAIRRRRKS